jgi:hypothetical protein
VGGYFFLLNSITCFLSVTFSPGNKCHLAHSICTVPERKVGQVEREEGRESESESESESGHRSGTGKTIVRTEVVREVRRMGSAGSRKRSRNEVGKERGGGGKQEENWR